MSALILSLDIQRTVPNLTPTPQDAVLINRKVAKIVPSVEWEPIEIGDRGAVVDSDTKTDASCMRIVKSRLAKKLVVGQQCGGLFCREQHDEVLHKANAFAGVGIPTFREQRTKQREGNASVNRAQHQNIDVQAPKFPVGADHCQIPLALANQQQARDQVSDHRWVDDKAAEETLQALIVGIRLRAPFQSRCSLSTPYQCLHCLG